MNHALPYLVGLLIALLTLFYLYSAAVASWHLHHSSYFTRGQKMAQHALVWLLPVVGVALVLSMLDPKERARRPGWIPLLEPILLSVFLVSASRADDTASHDGGFAESASSADGGGDGGAQ